MSLSLTMTCHSDDGSHRNVVTGAHRNFKGTQQVFSKRWSSEIGAGPQSHSTVVIRHGIEVETASSQEGDPQSCKHE
jgi:hypothetical protein